MLSGDRQGWPEVVVDPPTEIKEGDRILIRWVDGREETVTVTEVNDGPPGQQTFGVTLDPPDDLPLYRP